MTRSDVDLYEFLGVKDRIEPDDSAQGRAIVHAWRVKQCLLALAQVLIDSLVLPEPSMDVYDRLQGQIFAYLKRQGIDTSAIRNIGMTRRLARIYTILYALICVFDIPGAVHFDKEFELSHLLALIPYLYCTKQIALFALTQTEEICVNPMRAVVIKGAYAYAKFPYAPGCTVETYFKDDPNKLLVDVWRVEHPANDKQAMYNFNYVKLTGKYAESVLSGVGANCDPDPGEKEVDKEISDLTKLYIRVKPIRLMSKASYDAMGRESIVSFMLTREPRESRIPVVVRDYTLDEVYIATEALIKLHDDLIVDAIGECLYSEWRPQEIILGTQVIFFFPCCCLFCFVFGLKKGGD